MIKLPFVDRVTFLIERQFVKGAGFQLLVVAAVIGLLAVVGGAALLVAGADMRFAEAVWWAFLRMTDPGYLGDDEGTWRRVVSTALTVSGYVVFLGALVAIMTRWLIARMLEFERGLTPVSMRNHVVVIGWTNRTIPLLREILGDGDSRRRFLAAFGMRRLRAVVLSEEVSALQFQALKSDPVIGRGQARDIVLRYGSVLEEEAIRRAACMNAAAVIMPSDYGRGGDLVSPDVETIRALLSMDARAARHGQTPPLVIAEIQDARRIDTVRSAYSGPLEVVASDDTISRLLVQTILHPGLSAFLREVLSSRSGNEIQLRASDRLAGATLRDAASRFPRAIVLGLMRERDGQHEALLNAASDTRIEAGDLIVFLARTPADTEVAGGAGTLAPVERRRSDRQRPPVRGRNRILLLGWSRRVPNLIDELASYPGMNFELELVSIVDSATRAREIERYSPQCARVPVRHVEADYLMAGELERLDLAQFDSVFLLSSDQLENAEEADARVIVGQRIIEGLLDRRGLEPQILLELADAANEGLIRSPRVETLVSPMILSHFMAQITLRRETRLVFEELFTAGGAEIEFRPVSAHAAAGSATFAQLEAGVGARGDTLLGVQHADQGEGHDRGLVLNPPRDTRLALNESDRLCVLTSVAGA
ncbi:MAG: hypothetical protein WD397_11270 [Wenzhouxiangellaceae bacterium]